MTDDSPEIPSVDPLQISGPFFHTESPNPELTPEIEQLRREVHEKMRGEIENRILTNPEPTDEEIALGTFVEDIEPQVREAVREFNRKGYSTASSGFYGRNYQTIDGFLQLTNEEAGAVAAVGALVKVRPNGACYISFIPEKADLEYMTQKWSEIADAIPDRGYPALTSSTVASTSFREKYSNPNDVERVSLERNLANNKLDWDQTPEQARQRIKELKALKKS